MLASLAFLLAIVPAILFARNWRLYRAAPDPKPDVPAASSAPSISVLIPARNEKAAIGPAVRAALASQRVDLEVIVLDDHSTDGTAQIVREFAQHDPRVRLVQAPPLPAGWCGKQHACHVLSEQARFDVLAFLDADVRLTPTGLAQAAFFLDGGGGSEPADLVSGIPLQETNTLLEKLLIPLIHFVLLGYLPIGRMRASTLPAYGAGCGQFFMARREGYRRAGGHAAIRASLHDGITLPRAFRRAGLRTDLFDATGAAACRMYANAAQVWNGLAKNATEGMASPAAIVPWTVVLIGGQVLPWLLLLLVAARGAGVVSSRVALALSATACAASLAVRAAAARRFRQSWLGAVLHPLGVLVLVAIQWFALLRKATGRPAQWKGRSYAAGPVAAAAGRAPSYPALQSADS